MIEISPDYVLKSFGRFDETLANSGQFKERMALLTTQFKQLATTYLNFLGDDAKITGQEKRILIESLEEMLSITVMMRRLDFGSEQSVVVIEKGNGQFRIQLRFVDKSIWELSGSVAPEYKIKIGIFRDWFNQVLSEKIRGFLTEYGNSALDKDITVAEKEKIALRLDEIAIDLVEMILYIERFMQFQ
ncbi:MAG: hypothetical protein O9264_09640 [Leptospira sp.]|jgi:hypothetical protein|nr:hypothetical protein [Leptospira sp.]